MFTGRRVVVAAIAVASCFLHADSLFLAHHSRRRCGVHGRTDGSNDSALSASFLHSRRRGGIHSTADERNESALSAPPHSRRRRRSVHSRADERNESALSAPTHSSRRRSSVHSRADERNESALSAPPHHRRRRRRRLRSSVHGRADEHNETTLSAPPTGDIYPFIAIDKTGSSTMKRAIYDRASKKGWPSPCSCGGKECFEDPPPCAEEPDGAIFHAGWGYCNAIVARPCKPIVILREPVDRIISAYNYFCLDCRDDDKYCGRFFPYAACPHLSLLEFARRYDNLYTRMFAARRRPNQLLIGGDYGSFSATGFVHDVNESHLVAALGNLVAENVIVLALEDPLRLHRLAAFIGDPEGFPDIAEHANTNDNRTYVPSDQELSQLRQLNTQDVRLYNALFAPSAQRSDTQVASPSERQIVPEEESHAIDAAEAAAAKPSKDALVTLLELQKNARSRSSSSQALDCTIDGCVPPLSKVRTVYCKGKCALKKGCLWDGEDGCE